MSQQPNGGNPPPQAPQQQPQVGNLNTPIGDIPASGQVTFGGRTLAYDFTNNECKPTTDRAIITDAVRKRCGDKAATIVQNKLDPMSNFIPKEGAMGNFLSTVGALIIGGTAVWAKGKYSAKSASVGETDNVHNFEGNSSYNANFG